GELARDCRVIAIDRPGSGYSKRPLRSSASLAVQADVIAGLIDALQLDRPVVVGHSLGGAVALATALRHPDKISALALIAPLSRMPAGGPPGIFASLRIRWHWLRWLFAWTLMLPLAARQRERIMQTAFGPEVVPAHFALRGGGAQAMRPSNHIAASRDLVALEPVLPRLQEGYEDLQLPVHILYGWGDRILDRQEQGRVLGHQLAKGELELGEGGHTLPLTQRQRRVESMRRTRQQTAGCRAAGRYHSPSRRLAVLDLADHVAGDDHLLDLRGALVQAEQAHVAVEPLDGVLADVTGAAMDLHAAVGYPAAHFGGEHLGAGGLGAD